MGLGLLNKIDFLWFGVGLTAGLLLTDMRRHLKTPWPYAASGIALLVFSPFILWNMTHDFAHIEFIRNATAFVVLSVLTSLMLLPFAVPVLPVETFINYSAAVGVKPSTAEGNRLSELPQFYADMFGWEGLAEDVSAVYLALPIVERASGERGIADRAQDLDKAKGL